VRESLAALSDLGMEITEVLAPGREPAQSDAVRILMLLLDEDPGLWDEELRPWVESGNSAQVTAVVTKRTPEAVRGALSAGWLSSSVVQPWAPLIRLRLDGPTLFAAR
jgi:hypothetical protein